jgi:hypothetical protein
MEGPPSPMRHGQPQPNDFEAAARAVRRCRRSGARKQTGSAAGSHPTMGRVGAVELGGALARCPLSGEKRRHVGANAGLGRSPLPGSRPARLSS